MEGEGKAGSPAEERKPPRPARFDAWERPPWPWIVLSAALLLALLAAWVVEAWWLQRPHVEPPVMVQALRLPVIATVLVLHFPVAMRLGIRPGARAKATVQGLLLGAVAVFAVQFGGALYGYLAGIALVSMVMAGIVGALRRIHPDVLREYLPAALHRAVVVAALLALFP